MATEVAIATDFLIRADRPWPTSAAMSHGTGRRRRGARFAPPAPVEAQLQHRFSFVIAAIVACVLFASPTVAATIAFTASDLGGGRWQYDYEVSDTTFAPFDGFSIYFDSGLYSDLSAPSTANANWFLQALQPDIVLGTPVDGIFDAIAVDAGASLAAAFSIQFTFHGVGTPGAQLFDLTRFEPFDPLAAVVEPLFLDTLGGGETTAVPEPGTLLLVASGAALLAPLARRRSRAPE